MEGVPDSAVAALKKRLALRQGVKEIKLGEDFSPAFEKSEEGFPQKKVEEGKSFLFRVDHLRLPFDSSHLCRHRDGILKVSQFVDQSHCFGLIARENSPIGQAANLLQRKFSPLRHRLDELVVNVIQTPPN